MVSTQDFAQWSLDAIREEGGSFSWLEEQRFDWTTTTSQALEQILNGNSLKETKGLYLLEDNRVSSTDYMERMTSKEFSDISLNLDFKKMKGVI